MSVGLILVTHNSIGEHLLATARSMLGCLPLETVALAVSQADSTDELTQRLLALYQGLDTPDGVLVLTDMYGSTPSNIANTLLSQGRVQVVAGVNLPMLIRILNYPSLSLPELADKAISGGHDGILLCEAGT